MCYCISIDLNIICRFYVWDSKTSYSEEAMMNNNKPMIIDTLNISVVLPTFFKSKSERESVYVVKRTKKIVINPYHILNDSSKNGKKRSIKEVTTIALPKYVVHFLPRIDGKVTRVFLSPSKSRTSIMISPPKNIKKATNEKNNGFK